MIIDELSQAENDEINKEFDADGLVFNSRCKECGDPHKVFKLKFYDAAGKRIGCWCEYCQHFIGWVPKRMTVERARNLEVRVGKYAGRKVCELPLDYQKWILSAEIGNKSPLRNVKRALEVLFE